MNKGFSKRDPVVFERPVVLLERDIELRCEKWVKFVTWAQTYKPARMSVSFPATTNANVTAGLRWPPEMAPVAPAKKQIARPCAKAMATNLAQFISCDIIPAPFKFQQVSKQHSVSNFKSAHICWTGDNGRWLAGSSTIKWNRITPLIPPGTEHKLVH